MGHRAGSEAHGPGAEGQRADHDAGADADRVGPERDADAAAQPVRFRPNGAQRYLLDRLARKRFSVLVCHRGLGKTTLAVNLLVKAATEKPQGEYAYMAPFYKQAKAASWKTLKLAVPAPPVRVNESELRADFPNGAFVKLLGADDYDALRGMHLDGVVLDEYAQMDPAAWDQVVRPALAAKRGFALFIGTPKGRNHFHTLYHARHRDPEWYCTTYRFSDSGVIGNLEGEAAHAEVELARTQIGPDEFAQEYECSWEAALKGAYFARQLEAARAEGRTKSVSWEPAVPVNTFWDLGWSDATAIIFVQQLGRELHVIDYVESSLEGIEYYVRELARRPYLYGRHHLPHDAGHAQQAAEGRTLAQQRQEWDDKRQDWKDKPLHDWASHGADAFRYLAITVRDEQPSRTAAWAMQDGVSRPRPKPAKTSFDVYEHLHGRR